MSFSAHADAKGIMQLIRQVSINTAIPVLVLTFQFGSQSCVCALHYDNIQLYILIFLQKTICFLKTILSSNSTNALFTAVFVNTQAKVKPDNNVEPAAVN